MNSKALKIIANKYLVKKDRSRDKSLVLYHEVIEALELGDLRVAEKINNRWQVNTWIKEIILLGFKYGTLCKTSGKPISYFDKDTLLPKQLKLEDKIRMVSSGSTIRCGSYIAPGTIIMPPAFINIGAYIDHGCLIDSHTLVGSCAQIGKNVHLSAAAQIGGVLEPVGALPVIIEDNVFIGGNCGIYEGTIIKTGAVLGSGVILNGSTPIFDNVNNTFIKKTASTPLTIPENAVVIAGTRPITSGPGKKQGIQIYCPIIIKYKNAKTAEATALEKRLR